MPRRKYTHLITVEVSSDVDRGQRQMQKRFIRWVEAFGHTAAGHGFEFRRVGVITGAFVGEPEDKNG